MMPRHMGAIPVRSPWKTSRACSRECSSSLLAEQLLDRHAHVVEKDLAGRGRVHAHLVHRLAGRQPGRALLDDEGVERPIAATSSLPSSLA